MNICFAGYELSLWQPRKDPAMLWHNARINLNYLEECLDKIEPGTENYVFYKCVIDDYLFQNQKKFRDHGN